MGGQVSPRLAIPLPTPLVGKERMFFYSAVCLLCAKSGHSLSSPEDYYFKRLNILMIFLRRKKAAFP